MKRVPTIAALAAIMWFTVRTAARDEQRSFIGEISDSQCAFNVHSLTRSHQEMLKSKSMGGTSADCAMYCVKYLGGEYVLSTKADAYRLDNQEEAAKFAGETVKLIGVLGPKNTIHVASIVPNSKAKP